MSSIWEVLSRIDCSEHTEHKGQFSYLSWTWAWAMVKERYPRAHYELLEDTVYPDGTMEVRVKVSIGVETFDRNGLANGDHCEHTMWLPVLDFKNKPIQNPNAFDINSARMRCLVKCLAMFGLGHYIYAGESVPQAPKATQEQWETLLKLLANADAWGLRDFTREMGDLMDDLFNRAPDGQKTRFKQQVRELYGKSNDELKAGLKALEEAIIEESPDQITEILEEMGSIERSYVYAALDEVTKTKIVQLGVTL